VSILGRASGRHLHALAHNRDPRPVVIGRRRRSMGSQHAVGLSKIAPGEADTTLVQLVDRVTRRMRKAGRIGRTVMLRLRFGDFSRATRSTTMRHATAETAPILAAARELLEAAMPLIERDGLTMVGITVQNLGAEDELQLVLPLERGRGALDVALDEVRERFGSSAVTRAVLLGRRERPAMPMLPD
jgi:DNA polymerase-4